MNAHRIKLSGIFANRKGFALVSLLAIILIVTSLYAVDFVKRLGGDYTFYFSNGWFLHNGLRIYVDFWTHKPPLLAMLLALWIGVFGPSFYSAVIFLIITTILCSYAVFWLAYVLNLRRSICFLAGALFALLASLHTVDPDRNGIIIIFASIFEVLSLILLIVGLRRKSNIALFCSGTLIVMAVASRQTSLTIYIGLIAIIFMFNGFKALRKALLQSLVLSSGCLFACGLFLAYLFSNGADIRILWDQLADYNIIYAQTYRSITSVPAWFSFWIKVGTGWLLLFSTASITFVLTNFKKVNKERSIGINVGILFILLFVHFISLYLSAQTMPFYVLQLFPELSIVTSIVVVDAITNREASNTASELPTMNGKGFVIASIVMMMFAPIGREFVFSAGLIKNALAGGYLTDIRKLPFYMEDEKVIKKVQEIARSENDRIWLLQNGNDMVYIMSNRLPAISFTQCVPVNSEGYSDDRIYRAWLEQFMNGKPKIIVLFPEVDVTGIEILRMIKATVVSNMDRINPEDETPEIYAWRNLDK
jgi:hypothetical protein